MTSSSFQGFIPWIVYFVLAGSQYLADEVAVLAALAATIIFNFKNLRKKFILDWGTLLYFAFLSVMYLLPVGNWFNQIAFLLSNVVLALIMWVSIIIKKPFSMQYAKEGVDEIFWITPTFKYINYAISLVWALALSLMAIDGLLQSSGVASDWVADFILVSLFVIAIWFTNWFPDWYQGFLFKKFSKKKDDVRKNPYLQGNFAPIQDELFVTDLPIEGELPKELSGIYMRNGPNPLFEPLSYTFPLDGDGMLHAVYINEGKANYRNRFVETKGLIAEKKAGRPLYGGIARPIPVDPRLIGKDGDRGPVKDGAFIHIIRHAEQYLALYESGPAYDVSSQLKTIGEWCPPGGTRPFNVNAHTRLDPETGELYAFTYNLQSPYLQYYVLNKEGNLTHNIPIEKSTPSMMHDFILTKNYIVFFDCPAVFDLSKLATGGNLLSWQPELGVKIIVVNRQTNEMFSIEAETFFVYHFANGFEQNNHLIIDYVRHAKLALQKDTTASAKPPVLYRTVIDLQTKMAIHTQLDDYPVEFPRINEERISKPNRYIYIPTRTAGEQFNALIKYDLEKQIPIVHDFGENAEVGEAVFVPNSSRKTEDDGLIALFVYDKREGKSDFIFLNAQTFVDEPVAKIKLPHRVPHGLHGSWMPGPW
ncbi:carotenoid oxygenase family protein [Legionella cardiaca]|uniref:Carotenoid oxygenase family protein n=1 Tax=Legionella cardiaca TaxID=1071983 RepID=A0ABY8AW32_9GAMM|nr:carotenoid oxygenase family protein [Legionella cardiaca]WED43944.1 carotenoid oxygenase family protein [Legionella cardiaca]